MPNKNATAPARDGSAMCRLAVDTGAYSTARARIQYLAARHGLSFHHAAILAPIAFGVVDHV